MKFVFFSSLKPYPQRLVRKALKEKVVGKTTFFVGRKYALTSYAQDLHTCVYLWTEKLGPRQVLFTEGKAIKEKAS